MIDHYEMLRILSCMEHNDTSREDSLICRVEAALEHRPLVKHPEFVVPKGARGFMKVAQLIPIHEECPEEYLWFSVEWQALSLKRENTFAHYKRKPERSIWGVSLYLVEELKLIDIVAKRKAYKEPARGQTKLF